MYFTYIAFLHLLEQSQCFNHIIMWLFKLQKMILSIWVYTASCNMRDSKYAFYLACLVIILINNLVCITWGNCWADLREIILASRSYKHLQYQVTGSASVLLNLQSSHTYGGVVSDPIEGARYNERPLLVLRNAAGA